MVKHASIFPKNAMSFQNKLILERFTGNAGGTEFFRNQLKCQIISISLEGSRSIARIFVDTSRHFNVTIFR